MPVRPADDQGMRTTPTDHQPLTTAMYVLSWAVLHGPASEAPSAAQELARAIEKAGATGAAP